MNRRPGLVVLIGVALLALGPASAAEAELRSPPLATSCEEGLAYGEHVFGPWRVEGCSKSVEPREQDGETARRRFEGLVELNGMLVEAGGAALIATTIDTGDAIKHRILRNRAKLVLDPLITGARRRIVLYSGDVDLEITGLTRHEAPAPDLDRAFPAQVPFGTEGTIDLPVSGVPALLGLRLRDQIEGARVSSGTQGNPGYIEFTPPTSLGSTASDLLRDWEGKIKIKTVDGTGMTIDRLKFRVPGIELPPLGGFEDLVIRYSADRDEWSGSIFLDLGEPLFTLDLAMTVSASTGAPTRIAGTVDNLNIPIGNTGIFLQRVNALFNNNPLIMGVGAAATAGPEIAGVSLIEMSGDLEVRLELDGESNFRLRVDGFTRVLPVGAGTQLATGDMHVVIDSNGYISIGGDARYELLFEGLGVSANIGGSGAYSTTSDRFNIEAHATGLLHIPVVCKNGCDIARFEAVVSDVGWGTCGSLPGLFFWVQGGIAQDWERNPVALVGCDLSPYESTLRSARVAQAEGRTRSFVVRKGVKTLAVEATADGPEPRVRLVAPNGDVVATSVPLGNRRVGRRAAVIAQPDSNVQYFFLRKPAAGRWKLQWAADAPQVTGVRTAHDMPPVQAEVSVRRIENRPGRRQLQVRKVKGLARGEQLSIGIRTPAGVMPLGTTREGALKASFDELPEGRRAIVATVLRDGVPLPPRTRVIGRYRAKPPPAPRSVRARRRGKRVVAIARPRRGAELPDSWQYVLRKGKRALALRRAKPGRPVGFGAGRRRGRLTVTVRPVVNGRPLAGKPKTTRVSGRR